MEHFLRALDEIAPVVARSYGFPLESVREYDLELGPRGAVAEVQDAILRVVRDLLRQLSRVERFMAPAELAISYGLPCDELVNTIAAVLHDYHLDDPQAVEMHDRLAAEDPALVIPSILGLPDDHVLVQRVITAYQQWESPVRVTVQG